MAADLSARYYSPTMQRFISEDPINFEGGDTNLYAYVSNNPCNLTDPSGQLLLGACVGGAAFGVAFDLLSGRKPTVRSMLMGCALGMLFGMGGRLLGPPLRGLLGKLPRLPRLLAKPKGPGPSCFVAGTLVQTANGEKPIEEVHTGDLVLSFEPERADAASFTPQSHLVTSTFERTASVVFDIRIGSTTITATIEHPSDLFTPTIRNPTRP